MPKLNELFNQPLSVVNVGLNSMAQSVKDQGVPVIDVDWKPPVEGVPRLRVTKNGIDIDTANEEAIKRIKAARPTLVGMGIARDVIPGMHKQSDFARRPAHHVGSHVRPAARRGDGRVDLRGPGAG